MITRDCKIRDCLSKYKVCIQPGNLFLFRQTRNKRCCRRLKASIFENDRMRLLCEFSIGPKTKVCYVAPTIFETEVFHRQAFIFLPTGKSHLIWCKFQSLNLQEFDPCLALFALKLRYEININSKLVLILCTLHHIPMSKTIIKR